MKRVSVRGATGSGKTTTSRRLAAALGVPYIELDALHWEPNWQMATADEMVARVDAAIAAAPDGWVIDGNYRGKLGDLVLAQADTVVFLDLPLSVCMRRIWRRTWRRIVSRELLWNANRETFRNAFLTRDALWAWLLKTHARYRREFPEQFARHPHVRVVHLRSPEEVERFLAAAS